MNKSNNDDENNITCGALKLKGNAHFLNVVTNIFKFIRFI
jgi:hypothetical protein